MKKILMVAIVGASIALSGCQAMKDNPMLGVGVGVAAGAVAASIAAKHDHKDNNDNSRWDRDEHRNHSRNEYRNHSHHQYLDDNGVVYQDGVKGYRDAYGNFHAY